MQIKNGKDFWAGLMFLGVGLAFMIVSINNYNMGTAVRMGPAYFPTMLGGLCAVLGAAIFLRSFVSRIHFGLAAFSFRWLPLVIGIVLGAIAYWVKGPSGGGLWYNVLLAACLIAITGAFGPRHLYVILSAVIIFAYLLKPLGLYLSTIILVVLSRAGTADFKWEEVPKSVVYALVAIGAFLGILKLFQAFGLGGWAMAATAVLTLVGFIFSGKKISGVELGILSAVLGVFCISVFVFGLGLPLPVCPAVLDDTCRVIGLGK